MEDNKNLSIGDIVEIVSPGASYSNFGEQAKIMNLRYFEPYSEKPTLKTIGIITNIKEHLEGVELIYWIRCIIPCENKDKNIIKDFLFIKKGLKKITKEELEKEKDIKKLENIKSIEKSIKEEEKLEKKYYHQLEIIFKNEKEEKKIISFYSNNKEISLEEIKENTDVPLNPFNFTIEKHMTYFTKKVYV